MKMYILVNSDLSMGKGKIAGQVGHVISHIIRKLENCKNKTSYNKWIRKGEPKIILKSTENEMEKLYEKYSSISHKIYDMGKTQIKENSFTVLGFYPSDYIPDELLEMKLL